MNAINGACSNTSNCQPDCNEADIFFSINLIDIVLCGLIVRNCLSRPTIVLLLLLLL